MIQMRDDNADEPATLKLTTIKPAATTTITAIGTAVARWTRSVSQPEDDLVDRWIRHNNTG